MKPKKEFMLFKALGIHNPPEEAPQDQRTVEATYSFHAPVRGLL